MSSLQRRIATFCDHPSASRAAEPYRCYLLRRFTRIFPLFAVPCVAGYFAYKLQVRLFDYGFDPEFADFLRKVVVNTDQYFWIAHVTMLYGALSYNLFRYPTRRAGRMFKLIMHR